MDSCSDSDSSFMHLLLLTIKGKHILDLQTLFLDRVTGGS